MLIIILQHIILEALLDIFYWPIWWYSSGVERAEKWCFNILKSGNAWLAPGLWLKNLMVPMFGQYDWEGRIISFFMRLAQLLARSAALMVWVGVCIFLFMLWLVIPWIVVLGIASSL